MKNEVILVEPFLDGNAVALIKNGYIQDFFADFSFIKSMLTGGLFVGEVDRISRSLNSCFIKLPAGKMGFMRGHKGLSAGDKILLQSRYFTPTDKSIVVTQNLSFKGRYVIITPKNKKISCSRNIKLKNRQKELFELAESFDDIKVKNVGLIFRSICENSSDDMIIKDLIDQLKKYQVTLKHKIKSINQIEMAPKALDKAYIEWASFEEKNIIRGKGCFDNFSVWEQILSLKDTTVNLPSGGNLVVEKTQAFVAIDINTAKNNSTAAALKVNTEAISEIPRQLRLRGLGGKIIIEMGPLSKKHRDLVEKKLNKSILTLDKIRIAGWTPLGNLELEKPRERFPLTKKEFHEIEKNLL